MYKRYLYNTNYKYSSDYDFLLILVENNFEFCFIEKILANFSTNGASCSSDAYLETIDVRMKHNLISKKEAKHLIFGFKKHLLKEKIKNLI